MKEHYVSFEQADKLKELGFDWKCYDFYTEDVKVPLTEIKPFTKPKNWNEIVVSDVPKISAPRLDQAQSWLREVKGIDIEISAYQHLDGESVKHQYNFGVLTINGETFANTWYNNYEQALSDAIDTALELLGKEEKE